MRETCPSFRLNFRSSNRPEKLVVKADFTQGRSVAGGNERNISFIPTILRSPKRPEVLFAIAGRYKEFLWQVAMRGKNHSSRLPFISPKLPETFIVKAEAVPVTSVPGVNEGNISFIPPTLQFPETARSIKC
jgi:hypothetical protein